MKILITKGNLSVEDCTSKEAINSLASSLSSMFEEIKKNVKGDEVKLQALSRLVASITQGIVDINEKGIDAMLEEARSQISSVPSPYSPNDSKN